MGSSTALYPSEMGGRIEDAHGAMYRPPLVFGQALMTLSCVVCMLDLVFIGAVLAILVVLWASWSPPRPMLFCTVYLSDRGCLGVVLSYLGRKDGCKRGFIMRDNSSRAKISKNLRKTIGF